MCFSGIIFTISGACLIVFFFFQAEDGIRDLVRSRGLGDVYKRQGLYALAFNKIDISPAKIPYSTSPVTSVFVTAVCTCLLYTSDAADERSSVDLGGRRIIKKKKSCEYMWLIEL